MRTNNVRKVVIKKSAIDWNEPINIMIKKKASKPPSRNQCNSSVKQTDIVIPTVSEVSNASAEDSPKKEECLEPVIFKKMYRRGVN